LRQTAKDIDTRECALYVLSGEYDWSAYPAAAKALADAVSGASYTLMEGMRHFPMAEDPVQFKKYLMPVLAEIEAKS
jgi:pimeloyl-ACP methyl ester carboxylesterase